MTRIDRTLTLAACTLIALVGCATVPTSSVNEDEQTMTQGIVTTQRSVTLRYAPSFAAPVIRTLPANTALYWLGNQQRNGFYRVVGKDRGASGWVRGADVQVTKRLILSGIHAEAACATVLNQCTENGCAADGTPDALSNTLKHHVPTSTTTAALSFDDLAGLQKQADETVGSGVHIPQDGRVALANLTVSGGTVSEGDAIRVLGYLTVDGTGPHPNSSGESVNCGLKGAPNNDFHIPVTADPGNSEFEAFVIEMIPQNRPANWTVAKLKAVQTKQQQVWIEGNLFYDSVHRVNADPNNPIGGQPKRFSLWEVHPVTKFLVCEKATCNADDEQDWSPL